MFYKTLKLILLLGAITLFVLGKSDASLMLRQPSVNLFLKPGQVFSGGIILENVSGDPLEVKADFVDTWGKDGKPIPRACSKWIKLTEEKFILPGGGIKDLRFTVNVPKDAKGGYWTGLVYTYAGGVMQGPQEMTFNLKMHLEEPINITIQDTAKKDLSVEKMEVKYIAKDKIFLINSKIKNGGNIFTQVSPSFLILDGQGQILNSLKANSFKTYPDEEYDINYRGEMTLPKGENKLIAVFDFEAEKVKTVEKKFRVD